MMEHFKKRVLVAGATGMLGEQIAHHILNEGGCVRLLLRHEYAADEKKAAKIEGLTARGAEITPGALTDMASLEIATHGVLSVVSALQGGFDVIVTGQVALANAAIKNGVQRFIPSDYSVDLFKLPDGAHINLDLRRVADYEIAKMPIEMTNILNGGFMEVVFAPFFQMIDIEKSTVAYFGDSRTPIDVTTIADTAHFTAMAALEHSPIPGPFGVVGDVVTADSLCRLLSDIHQKAFSLINKGSIAELKNWIEAEQAAGRGKVWPTIGAQYMWAMMSGRARVTNPVNARYPSISSIKADEFLRRRVRSTY